MNRIGLTPNNALLTLIGQVPGGFIIGVHAEIKVKVHRQSFLPEGSQHLFFPVYKLGFVPTFIYRQTWYTFYRYIHLIQNKLVHQDLSNPLTEHFSLAAATRWHQQQLEVVSVFTWYPCSSNLWGTSSYEPHADLICSKLGSAVSQGGFGMFVWDSGH